MGKTNVFDKLRPIKQLVTNNQRGRRRLFFLSRWFVLCLLVSLVGCGNSSKITVSNSDLKDIQERGELRVITMESPFAYFVDEDDEMGYEYDLALNYADYLRVDVKLIVAKSVEEMKTLLLTGQGDVIAYRFPSTQENRADVVFTNRRYDSYPVLVQLRSKNMVKDVTDLVGKEVYAQKDTKYWRRLVNLNKEIGGGMTIKAVDDSIPADQLAVMVSQRKIPMTIVDNDVALLSRSNLRNIDISVPVGLPQETAWVVRKTSPELLASINAWSEEISKSRFYKQLYTKYYSKSRYFSDIKSTIPKGSISPYDEFFKQYAKQIDWDWRLLAALAFNESHFDVNAVSSSGALGLMQMMPGTGAKYGLDATEIFEAESAIAASVQYIKALNLIYRSVEDPEERIKFILASYNAGPAHVLDARALATKYGESPHVWNNVEKYLLLKNKPEYYNDEVCKAGYFRGKHTVRYVGDVFDTYNHYLGVKKEK